MINKIDCETLKKLNTLMKRFNAHEKIALGLNAYALIDATDKQLFDVESKQRYSEELANAIALLDNLSINAKIQLASDIIQHTFN